MLFVYRSKDRGNELRSLDLAWLNAIIFNKSATP